MDPGTDCKADDQEIALLMMDGDEEGLRLLLRTYGHKTLRVLKRNLGELLSEQDLEEALSSAAFRAFQAITTFDDRKATLFTWLYTIAHHCAVDIFRKEKKHHHEELLDGFRYEPKVDMELETRKPVVRALREAVKELPEQQKQVILADLAVHGEASDAELALRLGTTVGSVRVSRSKARSKLRDKVKGFFPEKERT